jgi:hypothetical protein
LRVQMGLQTATVQAKHHYSYNFGPEI